jgi:hypothetical protein
MAEASDLAVYASLSFAAAGFLMQLFRLRSTDRHVTKAQSVSSSIMKRYEKLEEENRRLHKELTEARMANGQLNGINQALEAENRRLRK